MKYLKTLLSPDVSTIKQAFVLVIVIFALDLATPFGHAIPTLYLLPLCLTWWSAGYRSTLLMGVLILLLLWGGVVVPREGYSELVLHRRTLYSIACLLVTLFLLLFKRYLSPRTLLLTQTQQVLKRKSRELLILAENIPSLFSYVDQRYCYQFVSNAYECLYHQPPDRIVGLSVRDLLGQENFERIVKPQLDRALAGEVVTAENRLVLPVGRIAWFAVRFVPDRFPSGQVHGVFILANDITTLKETELELRERTAQLQEMYRRLVEAQDTERRRLAQDLHDDIVQRLAAAQLNLHALAPDVGREIAHRLAQVGERLHAVATDLQQLSHRLHPSLVEHLGLEEAIKELLEDMEVHSKIQPLLITSRVPPQVPLTQSLCLYRICQEALHNIQKHARASTVLVRLLKTPHGLGVSVRDDGQGFGVREESRSGVGLGVTSMSERTLAVGGTLRITSRPGVGTTVHAWVPLP